MAPSVAVVYVLSVSFVLVFKRVPPEAASYQVYLFPVVAPEAAKVADDPIQMNAPVVVGVPGIVFTVKLVPLSVPVIDGVVLITRILYAAPATEANGIVAVMVPAAVDVKFPIPTAEIKLPAEFDNWAVKTFPAVNVPEIVNGTETVAPGQNDELPIVPVVIVCFLAAMTKYLFALIGSELVTPVAFVVPFKFTYCPVRVALAPIASSGVMVEGRDKEIALLVKLPVVASDQYSVVLKEINEALYVPPADPAVACT